MQYKVEYTQKAVKQLKKLDGYTRKLILSWIGKNLVGCSDPRVHGKGLSANKSGQWRYRNGNCRVICDIQDNELMILTLEIGYRNQVYKSN